MSNQYIQASYLVNYQTCGGIESESRAGFSPPTELTSEHLEQLKSAPHVIRMDVQATSVDQQSPEIVVYYIPSDPAIIKSAFRELCGEPPVFRCFSTTQRVPAIIYGSVAYRGTNYVLRYDDKLLSMPFDDENSALSYVIHFDKEPTVEVLHDMIKYVLDHANESGLELPEGFVDGFYKSFGGGEILVQLLKSE